MSVIQKRWCLYFSTSCIPNNVFEGHLGVWNLNNRFTCCREEFVLRELKYMMKSLIMVSDRATSFRPWQPCGWVRTGTWAGVGGNCQSLWLGEVNPGISPSKTWLFLSAQPGRARAAVRGSGSHPTSKNSHMCPHGFGRAVPWIGLVRGYPQGWGSSASWQTSGSVCGLWSLESSVTDDGPSPWPCRFVSSNRRKRC